MGSQMGWMAVALAGLKLMIFSAMNQEPHIGTDLSFCSVVDTPEQVLHHVIQEDLELPQCSVIF